VQSIPTWLEASGEWGLPCRARHVAHFWRAGAYDGVSKEPFLPLALLLLPLPSSSASNTMRLEQHHTVVLLFIRRKCSGRFCRRESASKGNPGPLKLHRYKQRGSKPSISLFTWFFFHILMFSQVES